MDVCIYSLITFFYPLNHFRGCNGHMDGWHTSGKCLFSHWPGSPWTVKENPKQPHENSERTRIWGFRFMFNTKDRGGDILYFYHCQQIPWKKQNKRCISPSLSAFIRSSWRCKTLKMHHKNILCFFKKLNNFLKQLGTVVFRKTWLKYYISWGLFSAAD